MTLESQKKTKAPRRPLSLILHKVDFKKKKEEALILIVLVWFVVTCTAFAQLAP